jgi:hypothetical protein
MSGGEPTLIGRYGVGGAGSLVGAGDVAVGDAVAVGEALAVGVGMAVGVGDGAGLVGAGVVGAGVVGAGVVGVGAVVAGGGTSLGRAVRPGTAPTPCGVVRPTARGWLTVVVELAGVGAGVVGSVIVGTGRSVVGSTGARGRARDTSSEVRTGISCGSSPPPAVISAMLKPEPERMTAVRIRKASLRPGSSRR